jgi:hypothetical protein
MIRIRRDEPAQRLHDVAYQVGDGEEAGDEATSAAPERAKEVVGLLGAGSSVVATNSLRSVS